MKTLLTDPRYTEYPLEFETPEEAMAFVRFKTGNYSDEFTKLLEDTLEFEQKPGEALKPLDYPHYE